MLKKAITVTRIIFYVNRDIDVIIIAKGVLIALCSLCVLLDDVNLIGDDIRTIERNGDVLLNACKDISLAENTGKTKYMEIGCHRGMIANAHIRIGSNSYEKGETFKYLGSLLTSQSSIQEEIKVGNCCYYSVQTRLHSLLLSNNLKIKMYKTITLPVVFYGCFTWSLTLREECRLRVFENRIPR